MRELLWNLKELAETVAGDFDEGVEGLAEGVGKQVSEAVCESCLGV